MEEKEAFEILGLTKDASFREVMEAHRDLVEVWEPKRFTDNPRLESKAVQKIKEINQAFDLLRNSRLGDQKLSQPKSERQRHKSRKRTIDEALVGSQRELSEKPDNVLDPFKSRARKKSTNPDSKKSIWLITVIVVIVVVLFILFSSESIDQEKVETTIPHNSPSVTSPELEGPKKEQLVDQEQIHGGGANQGDSESREAGNPATSSSGSETKKNIGKEKTVVNDGNKPVLKREVIE